MQAKHQTHEKQRNIKYKETTIKGHTITHQEKRTEHIQ